MEGTREPSWEETQREAFAARAEPDSSFDEPPPASSSRGGASPIDAVVSDLLGAMSSLPDKVELPSQLFTLLASRLVLRKAALLLYDPLRLVYAPWASIGYDQTTLHRMRIPLGANGSFNALGNGAPVTVDGAALLSPFQQYFSAREFSSLSRLLLTPFIAEEKLIGVLLVSSLTPPLDNDQDVLSCLARVADAAAPRLQQARERRLQAAGLRGVHAPAGASDEAGRFIAAFGSSGSALLFLALSTEEYARAIIAAHVHLDPFRLHEDMHYFLDAFVADLGMAIPLRQGVFIVGLKDVASSDLDLFLHQLTSFLHGLFGGNGGGTPSSGPLILKTRSWPAEGSDVQRLVEYLSS